LLFMSRDHGNAFSLRRHPKKYRSRESPKL
jgi:hypothetical protein